MPEITLVQEPIRLAHLTPLAEGSFGGLVKAVVDVDLGIMSVAGELHADEEALLLDAGSQQGSLWGINLFPAEQGQPGWTEFDSMIKRTPATGQPIPLRRGRCCARPNRRDHRPVGGGMSATLHAGLAAARWRELTLMEQLANIGSEVGRASRAKAVGNDERLANALDRCLELFDLTLADSRWRYRRREIARAREVVCDFLIGSNAYGRPPSRLMDTSWHTRSPLDLIGFAEPRVDHRRITAML